MNFWKKIESLGITDDMPVYRQKSTMFFNIAMRISMIFMIVAALLMFFIKDMVYTPLGFLAGMPVIGFSLFLNYKGKVNLSVFIISIFFPLYFIAMSLFSKSHGEGLEFIFYVLPRFGIIVMTILSFAVLGFNNMKIAFAGTIIGILAFFFFGQIHSLFDLGIDKIDFYRSDLEFIVLIIGVLFMFFVGISSFLQKINSQYEKIVIKQKDAIEEKNEKLSRQKKEIEEIHHEISQSIDYATCLQTAILPEDDILIKNISDYFILFKPKDKVSGDFYWWTNIEGQTIITAVDCTGHGVPGAFMSMLGVSFLREIVTKEYITHPGIILRKLRTEVIKTLKQKAVPAGRQGEAGEQSDYATATSGQMKDGMDMSLVSIEHDKNMLHFAGANNPLYFIRDGELTEIKGDKMPIAIHQKMDKFSTHKIELNKGDQFYMFSDGFADQFGGPKGKKFKSKSFKQLLIDNANKPMAEQKESLEKTISDWMGHINPDTGKTYEQIDDIVVVGIKI